MLTIGLVDGGAGFGAKLLPNPKEQEAIRLIKAGAPVPQNDAEQKTVVAGIARPGIPGVEDMRVLPGEVMLAPARDRRYCPRGYRHFKEGGVTRTFDPRRCHPVDWLLLLTVLLVPLGCSFSASSNSLSDSFASSSKSSKSSSDSSASSSASSSPGDSAYYDNVRSTTEAYAKSGGPFDAYQKKLGDLAKERGVTNWEENLGTYAAIGEGLGQAKASQGLVDTFKSRLTPPGSANSADKQSAIQKGYESKK